MFDVKPIIKRLKSYREEHSLTQTEIAKRLGVSNPTLSRWLNERTGFNPTLNQLVSMAEMYGVSLVELLSQKDDASPASEPARRTRKTTKDKAPTKTKAVSASNADGKKTSGRAVKASKPDTGAAPEKKKSRARKASSK